MGINIDDIYHTGIRLISIYNTYYVVQWWPLPTFFSVSLARKLMRIPKKNLFSNRGPWSLFCQLHSSRTSYYASTNWILYWIKLSHLVTDKIETENQYCSQQLAWPSNCSSVQCLHLVCQMVPLLYFYYFCTGNRFKQGKTNNKSEV